MFKKHKNDIKLTCKGQNVELLKLKKNYLYLNGV